MGVVSFELLLIEEERVEDVKLFVEMLEKKQLGIKKDLEEKFLELGKNFSINFPAGKIFE